MDSKQDIYKNGIDFMELGKHDPGFSKFLSQNGQLDFTDPEAVMQLTKSLLKRDFDLRIDLPPDRLCPPVPNRLAYILWIQSLLDTTSTSYSDTYEPARQITGLDIGTGASCIYPLLGCATRPNWQFVATDIDLKSLSYARKNIDANNLTDRIHLHTSDPAGPIIPPLDQLPFHTLDFTMTNPPFYTSSSALLASAAAKSLPPSTACTGAPVEMIYDPPDSPEGGEVAFAHRILQSSLTHRTKIQWYTTLFGHASSVSTFIPLLRTHNISNYTITEFVTGSGKKTRRWGVGWSFCDRRPTLEVARGAGVDRGLCAFPSEVEFFLKDRGKGGRKRLDVETVEEEVSRVMGQLKLRGGWKWLDDGEGDVGTGFSDGDVWSRAARRRAARAQESGDGQMAVDGEEPSFGFKISLQEVEGGVGVHVRWLKGLYSVVFESFCGLLKRKLDEALVGR